MYPSSKISTNVVEPYNSILATDSLLSFADHVTVFDNEAINDICRNSLKVERPTYGNLNRLIAKVVSSMTLSIRFGGSNIGSLSAITHNLTPYPRIHFLTTSLAPIYPRLT